ncbi:BlaI/MecI/CopY family transcriptional regulator [Streptomyces sp. GTA36]
MTASRSEQQGARELESEVLAALWAADRALTAAEIQAELGCDLAHSTVYVILRHLCGRGLITSASDTGGTDQPLKDAAEMTAQIMHQAQNRKPAAGASEDGAPSSDAPAPQPVSPPARRPWGVRATSPPVRQSPSAPIPSARPQGDPPQCPHTSQS